MEKSSQLDFFLLPSTLIRLFFWISSIFVVLFVFVSWVTNEQRTKFYKESNDAFFHVNEQLVINDAALAGFGSLLTSIGTNNIQKTRNFTKRMRTAYPHIYMFEGLTSVDPENKAQHQEKMQKLGYPDYEITRYVSKKNPLGKTIDMVNGVPMYFPIFYIDPYLDSVKGLMGFDMMSTRNMRVTLLESIESGKPVASAPWSLKEGGRGYTLIKALGMDDSAQGVMAEHGKGGLAVLIVIKIDTMLAPLRNIVPEANIQLLYGEGRKLATQEIFPQALSTPIIEIDTLVEEYKLEDLGQPFILSIKQSSGLFAPHIQAMAMLFLLMCFIYGAYYRSLIAKYRLQLQRDSVVLKINQQHDSLEIMVASRTKALQRKSDENISLVQQLIRVQEDQIHHIARELHDGFGQTLTVIKINAHILENTKKIKDVYSYAQDITAQANTLYDTMHDMIQRLRPEALDMFGLKASIEQCISAFHLDEQGIELELYIDDKVNTVEEIISIASYRIVQELVNNALKYAKLAKLKVSLFIDSNDIVICVEDDGIGFDPLKNKVGFGLSGVDERARSLGGMVDINTQIDEGVKVLVRIPIPQTQI